MAFDIPQLSATSEESLNSFAMRLIDHAKQYYPSEVTGVFNGIVLTAMSTSTVASIVQQFNASIPE